MASTHITLGIGCWSAYSYYKGIPPHPISMGIAAISALLPDIDHPKSKFGRMVPFLSYPISYFLGHRGITHSLLAIFVSSLLLIYYGLNTWYVAPIVVGYLSHLLGDMFTNSGIPLFWPNRRKIAFPIFNTGGMAESGFRLLLTISVIGLVLAASSPLPFF